MIGYFRDAVELQAWADAQALRAREDYQRDGALVSLGYAMAMADIAGSVVDPRVEPPAYQLAFSAVEAQEVANVVLLRAA